MRKNIIAFGKGAIFASFLLGAVLILRSILGIIVSANDNLPQPPEFSSCQSQIKPGDWAHYDYGIHGVPGVGNLEGQDDVYSLSSGNFLQCFCRIDEDTGIQTFWWNVERLGLTEEQISTFVGQGWILENGAGWNLFNERYLVKNADISCAEPTPTPTPMPTPTPTPTVTPTPTPGEEPESRCVSLSVSPSEGTAPLTVKFNGSGFDEAGDIKRYKFDFGDSSGGQSQIWEQDGSEAAHRYENPGTYTAGLHVKDSRGNWRNGGGDCKKTITVSEKPKVLGKKIVKELPKTGASLLETGLVLVTMGTVGAYLYKRFKLI